MVKVVIRELAETKGLTTAYRLMKATGVQPSVAAKWWTGEFDKIGIRTLDLLCEVLECEPGDLFVRTPNKKGRAK